MVDATHKSLMADDRSYFSLIKKDIRKLAATHHFDQKKLNDIDIIVSELTSNLQKHTVGGAEILFGYIDNGSSAYLEIICIDNGPGIADVKKVTADGFSSSGTLGHGFGSINRKADFLEIYSLLKWGTVILVRINQNTSKKQKELITGHQLVVAKPGEETSGDGCYMQTTETGFKYLVADGLGHGPFANEAVNAAVKAFSETKEQTASEILRYMHREIKKTRGVVANVLIYNTLQKQWSICGVGNISTRLSGGQAVKNFIPYNGIVGHNIPTTLNDMVLPQAEYNHFISCSDGIKSRWDLQKFPMIYKNDPAILSAVLYKEYARRNDDMSVIVCKIR